MINNTNMKQYVEPTISIVDLNCEGNFLIDSNTNNEVVEGPEHTEKKGWSSESWTKE